MSDYTETVLFASDTGVEVVEFDYGNGKRRWEKRLKHGAVFVTAYATTDEAMAQSWVESLTPVETSNFAEGRSSGAGNGTNPPGGATS